MLWAVSVHCIFPLPVSVYHMNNGKNPMQSFSFNFFHITLFPSHFMLHHEKQWNWILCVTQCMLSYFLPELSFCVSAFFISSNCTKLLVTQMTWLSTVMQIHFSDEDANHITHKKVFPNKFIWTFWI